MNKTDYYLNIAEVVSQKSTCLQKHWGAIIVKDNVIISTGYNGAPRKIEDCEQKGYCNLTQCRNKNNDNHRGTMYEQCYSVHAEQNAIIFGNLERMKKSTMYLVGLERNSFDGNWNYVTNPTPCKLCRKMIVNAGINKIIVRINKETAQTIDVQEWIKNPSELIGAY